MNIGDRSTLSTTYGLTVGEVITIPARELGLLPPSAPPAPPCYFRVVGDEQRHDDP